MTLETGELFPFTVSFGGVVDVTGATIEGVIVTSDGIRYVFLAAANPQCTLPAPMKRQEGERQEFGY